MPSETQIYIRIEGASGSSWRPVQAVRVEENVYRILEGPEAGSAESWPFTAGDLVRCRPFELTDHDLVLVAYERATGNQGPGGQRSG